MFSVLSSLVLVATVAAAEQPPFFKQAEVARWLAHENLWGTLSTLSVHLNGAPFGQPKSFVDGTLTNSTGELYFYDSEMDESMKDIAADHRVSFSLSSASLGLCGPDEQQDPENPTCARAAFSGSFVLVSDTDEEKFAKRALFERHPMMPSWPHDFDVYKIDLTEIWLIDMYGEAKTVDIEDYFAIDI